MFVTGLLQGRPKGLGGDPRRRFARKLGHVSSYRHPPVRFCAGMRIMIVTDAWFPQTNGVVSTLAQTAAWLGRFGHEVRMVTPRGFRSIACPTYPEIRLPVLPTKKLKRSML